MLGTAVLGNVLKAGVLAGWTAFALIFLTRRRPSTPEIPAVARSPRSAWGIGVQAVAFAIVWSRRRPATMPIFPLPSLDLVVALAVMALMIASLTITLFAVRALGRQWAFQARTVEDHQLISTGPYRFVRHPIYTGMGGMLIATGVTLTGWWALAVAVLLFAAGTSIRTQAEDSLLAQTFGATFEAYRQRVPAVIPRFGAR